MYQGQDTQSELEHGGRYGTFKQWQGQKKLWTEHLGSLEPMKTPDLWTGWRIISKLTTHVKGT